MKKSYPKVRYPQANPKIIQQQIIPEKKKKNSVLFIIIAFGFPVMLYLQTINFGFTYFDDDDLIIKNITFLSNFGNASQAFLTDAFIDKSSSFYRPLQTLSYMADIHLSGENGSWMLHLTNILLLGLIACLLFLFLGKISIPPKLAILGTLIYCAHPLFVSTIAFIPTRGELLLTLFSLLSFLFFIEFLQKKKILFLFLNWIAFTLALFSKETAALLPFLFIIYYFTFSPGKTFNKKLLLVIPFYAISGIFWFWLRSKAIVVFSNPNDVSWLNAILINFQSLPESLTKFFFPFDLAPIPGFSFFKTFAGCGIIVIMIILFLKKRERQLKEKIFCFSWFIILMLPPLLFKHPHINYLDHRFFLPLMGVLLFLLFIFPKKWLEKGYTKRVWLWIAVLIFLSSFTFIKSRPYSDAMTFYNYTISKNPNSALAYNNRGNIKISKNDFQGALKDFTEAIAVSPEFDEAYNNRGVANINLGNFKEAISDYSNAIAIRPDYGKAYVNRGVAKSAIGDEFGAIEDYNKAIAIIPDFADAYYYRGLSKANMGKFLEAVQDYDSAIAILPSYAEAYNKKGLAIYATANYNEAIICFDKAIEMKPDYSDAYYNRGLSYFLLGKKEQDSGQKYVAFKYYDLAIKDNTAAIEYSPGLASAYFNRSGDYYVMGKFEPALSDALTAKELGMDVDSAYIKILKSNIKSRP